MGDLVADLSVGRELVETHISWVFLGADTDTGRTDDTGRADKTVRADNTVYKVKKPVNLGFLDFTQLSERKRLCELEVQLNQRLSHGVYLGVVPVVRDTSGKHAFGKPNHEPQGEVPGNVVDYAVHMRRMAEQYRLDVLLSQGRLSRVVVSAFASHLAHFHAKCGSNSELEWLGMAEAIGKNVEENFTQLGGALEAHLPRAQANALPFMQRDFIHRHGDLFAERATNGKVRDGHGDLRLEHVYAEPTGIQVLDCIEFNDRFRYADVCADLAFITMDLRHHGRPDLAEALAAAYAAETCDFQLYSVLNFYESYRAVVRAKVTYLALSSKNPHDTHAHAEVRRYLTQAFEALRGVDCNPRVIAVGGLIASGKSHTANELGALLSCPIITTDRLRKHLHRADAHEQLHASTFDGAYSEAATQRTYALLLANALHVLRSGRSVILDATYRSAVERERLVDFCRTNGVPLYFVECTADETTLRQRLRAREHQTNVSDAREPLLDAFMRRYEAPSETELGLLCQLDTTLPKAERDRIIAQFLGI